ncbi:MAG: hypothetical protein K2P78_10880, partial [Gemmataceae bacterium]|nr:hypothetical protein [Gemmataceae bacterium]
MAALRAGEYPAAVRTAHRLYESSPSPENLGVLKATLLDAGWHFADRDKMDEFIEVAADVAKLDPDNPAWVAEWAALLARAGMAEDGLKLLERTLDPATGRPKVLAFAADRAVRRRSKERLPEELHAGLDAVLAAFRHHEAGNEAAAREALEPIGLRSPFLEWKVLLRGLLAHAA